jgi:hypothetical protein
MEASTPYLSQQKPQEGNLMAHMQGLPVTLAVAEKATDLTETVRRRDAALDLEKTKDDKLRPRPCKKSFSDLFGSSAVCFSHRNPFSVPEPAPRPSALDWVRSIRCSI